MTKDISQATFSISIINEINLNLFKEAINIELSIAWFLVFKRGEHLLTKSQLI